MNFPHRPPRTPLTSLTLRPFAFRPIALSLLLALGSVAPAALAQTAPQHNYDLPAAPLAATLNRISREAGLALSVDAGLVGGRQAAPVHGLLSAEQALRAALAGSGLELVRTPAGTYTLRQLPREQTSSGAGNSAGSAVIHDAAPTLAPVAVSGYRTQDGTAQSGYVVRKPTSIGPWQGRSLQDTPYAISVTPAELIENIQATSPDQVFKMNPATQLSWPTLQNENPYVYLRGFQSSTSARNGLPRDTYGHGTSMEDVERIEILTGLSGFLYGAGNVGGLINYVSKRPTPERYNSVSVGYTGGRNGYVHGDFGGPIDSEGRFGYRINAVAQDGETWINDYKLRKNFISGAFDWHVTDRLLVQVDASRREFRSQRQPYWYLASGVTRPSADTLDPSKLWSQPWSFMDVDSTRVGSNLSWEISDAVSVRAAYLDQNDTREYASLDNTVQANGTYNQTASLAAPQEQKTRAYSGFVDIKFDTGPVRHKLTAGHIATRWRRFDFADNGSTRNILTGAGLGSPTYVPEPAWDPVGRGQRWERLAYRKNSWMIGDDVTFSDQWSLLIGVNHSTIDNMLTWAGPSAPRTGYSRGATTPTLSLIYKPLENLTAYASYMESLEPGAVADNTYGGYKVTNAGTILNPLMSKQVEVGAKATVGGMLLTSALFQIDKGLQYYDLTDPTRPTYVQSGRQVHQGVELTASGKLTPDLTLIGGLTVLDASVRENRQTPALEGKRPIGVAEKMFKVYAEYTLPGFRSLSLNGGVNYVGNYFGNATNTDRISGYTLVDVGVRYVAVAGANPVTLRLNVNNLTDRRYWVNQNYLGDARNVVMSANVNF